MFIIRFIVLISTSNKNATNLLVTYVKRLISDYPDDCFIL